MTLYLIFSFLFLLYFFYVVVVVIVVVVVSVVSAADIAGVAVVYGRLYGRESTRIVCVSRLGTVGSH